MVIMIKYSHRRIILIYESVSPPPLFSAPASHTVTVSDRLIYEESLYHNLRIG